jgi:hypothetical protein
MQCDGLKHIGSEAAKRRNTIEDAILGYNALLYDEELLKVLVDAICPLFYDINRLAFYQYVHKGDASGAICAFVIAVLRNLDSRKIVLLTAGFRDVNDISDIIWRNIRTTGIDSWLLIKLDGRNEVGAQWKVEGNGICGTLVIIPPWDCNIRLVDGADLVICYDAFKNCDDNFIKELSSRAPCVFVDGLSYRVETVTLFRHNRWYQGNGYRKTYRYNMWLCHVISELNLPKELLSHISGFVFGEGRY